MPPAPPVRTVPANYHFHTYDYAGALPFQTSPAQPWARNNWQFYSLVRDLGGLAAFGTGVVPNLAAIPTVVGGPTTEGRQTLMLSFGNAGNVPGRPTVVITGGVHAREWIAAEVAYLIAEYLIANYMAPVGGNPHQAHLQNLVDTRNIHIIPMLNPDGNNRTVFGWWPNSRNWRKNLRPLPRWASGWTAALVPAGLPNPPTPPFANVQQGLVWTGFDVPDYNPVGGVPAGAAPGAPLAAAPTYQTRTLSNGNTGVDVNRNMHTTGWGYDPPPGGDWDPADVTFFGTAPGGETEAANVAVAMAAAAGAPAGNISVALDYHSYSRMILYPSEQVFGAGGVAAIAAPYTRVGNTLQILIVDGVGGQYQLGSAGALLGYDATGTVADYAAEQHQARAFTIELDPAHNDPVAFQLPETQIQDVFETNIRGALAAIEAPVNHVANMVTRATYLPWAVHGAGNQVP
jgi:Zinc carboxypeptidase